ncbi:MAG TPA: tRNA (adenosine(37)-N6)-threonylcarbamoyltransferase complex dimerization subunit type 1 TsaB, partial [Chitinophagaceae bacterium]|nr:tRNA (adenosine(37)-N6)-threonylcarbamoyltransferase complex dimerization subunit type 1 TsaB [Chitinophagaceae bacterium]
IDKNSFDTVLANKEILFCGNAINKVQPVIASPNAQYINTKTEIEEMAKISADFFHQSAFADLAYAEPFYVKDFYSPSIKK